MKDVTVTIDIQRSSKLVGLGKPVILAKFEGEPTYKSYGELEDIGTEYGVGTAVYNIAKAMFSQGDTSPEKIAVLTYNEEKTAAEVLDKFYGQDFYFVTADTQVPAEVKAIADVVEGKEVKMFGTTATALEAIQTLFNANYERTFAPFHSGVNAYLAEGLIGENGSKAVGSTTWKFKTINGLEASELTDDQLADIHALNSFAYVTKSGVPQTSEGITLSGEYIDVVHSKDWIKLNIEEAIQNVFVTNDKVPFTNDGIALLAVTVEGVLMQAAANGMINIVEGVPQYSVTTISREETPAVDRETRVYNGLSFDFELAGAIHNANVKGLVKL